MWINVGGGCFNTLKSTLRKSGTLNRQPTLENIFIDRDPSLFYLVLHWLRTEHLYGSDIATLEALREEEEFYDIPNLKAEIQRQLSHACAPTRIRRSRRD